MIDHPLNTILAPQSIAIVGASNNPTKMGTMQFLNIIHSGFKGAIYPIHPKETTIYGKKAYQHVHDLPSVPDLGILIVPTNLVQQFMEDFGRSGIKHALIITAGFKETGESGKKREQHIKDIAIRYNMRFLGPNCLGVINSHLPFNATVAPTLGNPGALSMASQSGTYVAQSLMYLHKRGISFSKAISLGNEADIDLVDCLEYFAEDDTTKAIGLYIECIRRPEKFLDVARQLTRKKPVIAQYVGGTDAGARSCSSHTGAMTGPDYMYQGLFEQAGIIRAQTIEEVYTYGHALATQPPLKGKRIAILTNSGGPGTAMATTLDEYGLEVPQLSSEMQKKIQALLPGHASPTNPVDLTFHTDMTLITDILPNMLLASEDIDGLLIHGIMDTGWAELFYPVYRSFSGGSLDDLKKFFTTKMDALIAFPKTYQKPIIVNSFFGREDRAKNSLIDNGIIGTTSPELAAKIMAVMYLYSCIQNKKRTESQKIAVPVEAQKKIEAFTSSKKPLTEYQAKQLLKDYNIPVCKEHLTNNIQSAMNAAHQIGYPVVMKGCVSGILHKTEHQLVYTSIQSDDQLESSCHEILRRYQSSEFLICEQIESKRELMAGMIRKNNFPPCITLGFGGIFAEVVSDIKLRLAPLSYSDACEMIHTLKTSKMLTSFREMPDLDIDALADILIQLGHLSCHFETIKEIDLNPIMIQNGKPVVVDALIS
jgi:acetyltransferase